MPSRRSGRADVVFDEAAFQEDLRRVGAAARDVARTARDTYMRAGCPIAELRACDDEARDATHLPGCAKAYLPPPAGRFGMVFAIERKAGALVLAYLAFGARHHPHDSNAPTVYQLAHRRLHD